MENAILTNDKSEDGEATFESPPVVAGELNKPAESGPKKAGRKKRRAAKSVIKPDPEEVAALQAMVKAILDNHSRITAPWPWER